ncbi:hypothetical protein GPECTOR_18g92 [Gonium pectorale]|uniref:Uncharacterized protein n=1 Tax=Gonium pectorale TaxID=33097 RepID=A0A150GJW1_GONPE|nr:hypothetical protein GPECTOR_18g92 [Gonium pectorale]|eukprot:KXZ50118.1 hypothetical protein GPECTOR_18g92 [Gonium pectorale]
MVGEIVDEVTREMFISEAVAYIQDDRPDQTELHAVRTAVMRRLEFLDANFLTALGGFIAASERRGDAQLATMLTTIRAEVLRQVSSRMPAAAQVLDMALRHADKDARLAVLRAALAGGASDLPNNLGDVPAAEVDTLSATASKFIDEMEEQPQVLDRRLLARLVLVREELRLLREEVRFTSIDAAPREPVRSNVPQRCAAFLKELVPVGEPLRRVALLTRAFESDWDGAAPRQKPQTAFHANQPDFVRPGRFLATLQSMVVQLEEQVAMDGEAALLKVQPALHRLEAIRGEALAVLDKMQSAGVREGDPVDYEGPFGAGGGAAAGGGVMEVFDGEGGAVEWQASDGGEGGAEVQPGPEPIAAEEGSGVGGGEGGAPAAV